MVLKAVHFIGIIFRFIWCQLLLLIGRYDKKYCHTQKYKGIFAEGWFWLFHDWWGCLISGSNSSVPWPVSAFNKVVGWQNVIFDPEDIYNFQGKGCYFQAVERIIIGKGTFIANNVGIITSNHDLNDLSKHNDAKPVLIGKSCWLGMNSVILPGVELGDHTIVAAGTVVTHSFPEGYCVIAGNPAHVIKIL